METSDKEVNAKAFTSMEKAKAADKPFFIWWNSTKMHGFTHLEEGVAGKTGLGIYADGMVEHDRQVGEVLAKLEELGLAEDTIVMYENGPNGPLSPPDQERSAGCRGWGQPPSATLPGSTWFEASGTIQACPVPRPVRHAYVRFSAAGLVGPATGGSAAGDPFDQPAALSAS